MRTNFYRIVFVLVFAAATNVAQKKENTELRNKVDGLKTEIASLGQLLIRRTTMRPELCKEEK